MRSPANRMASQQALLRCNVSLASGSVMRALIVVRIEVGVPRIGVLPLHGALSEVLRYGHELDARRNVDG